MIQQTIFDIFACFFVAFGVFFMFVGALGILRFPDAYNRLHAATKCTTLGLAGLALAAVFHIGTMAVLAKALIIILFAFVATPVGSHILAKAAHMDRMKQWNRTLADELCEDKPDQRPRNADELAAGCREAGEPGTGYIARSEASPGRSPDPGTDSGHSSAASAASNPDRDRESNDDEDDADDRSTDAGNDESDHDRDGRDADRILVA